MVPDPDHAGHVAAVADWNVVDGRFVISLTPLGAVQAGEEVFISYGAKEPAAMIVNYGFLPSDSKDFVEPSELRCTGLRVCAEN